MHNSKGSVHLKPIKKLPFESSEPTLDEGVGELMEVLPSSSFSSKGEHGDEASEKEVLATCIPLLPSSESTEFFLFLPL